MYNFFHKMPDLSLNFKLVFFKKIIKIITNFKSVYTFYQHTLLTITDFHSRQRLDMIKTKSPIFQLHQNSTNTSFNSKTRIH